MAGWGGVGGGVEEGGEGAKVKLHQQHLIFLHNPLLSGAERKCRRGPWEREREGLMS